MLYWLYLFQRHSGVKDSGSDWGTGELNSNESITFTYVLIGKDINLSFLPSSHG